MKEQQIENEMIPPWINDDRLSKKAKEYMTWITHSISSKELCKELKKTINDPVWDELINHGYIKDGFKESVSNS